MLNKPSDRISMKVQHLFSNVDPHYNLGPRAACRTAPCTEEEVVVLWASLLCVTALLRAAVQRAQLWVAEWHNQSPDPLAWCSYTAGTQIHFSVCGSRISSSAWAQVICGTFSINCSLFWELHISIWLCHIVWSFTTNAFEIYPCSGNC